MEILSFDYGDKRIGYAIASKKMKMAFAKDFIINDQSLEDSLKALISLYQPQELVVGLPLRQNLSFTPATDKALCFAKKLFDLTHLSIYLVDERYSTVFSQTALRYAGRTIKKSKAIIDSESAKSIAETYLQNPAWKYVFNTDCLTESAVYDCIYESDSDVFYFMGAKNVFNSVVKFEKKITIYELNPYIFSLERNKEIPENIQAYRFVFSVPEGYQLYQEGAHGSTG